MNRWIVKISGYMNKFIELGVLLLAISVIAEILFGPDVVFFGSQVTSNLINLLNSLGEQGIAALIIVFAVIYVYRKILKPWISICGFFTLINNKLKLSTLQLLTCSG